jgi:hypothetical protein
MERSDWSCAEVEGEGRKKTSSSEEEVCSIIYQIQPDQLWDTFAEERWSYEGCRGETHLHDPLIDDALHPIVPLHPMCHPDLDDLVLRDGRGDGIDQFGQGVRGSCEDVLACGIVPW